MRPDYGAAAASIGVGSEDSLVTVADRWTQARTASRTLLLVEDDQALRQMLVWELTELGYSVHAVGDCREANAAMSAGNFDLALLDVGLPDGDGGALAGELAAVIPGIKIILCSGRFGAGAQGCIHPEVLACLAKPVSAHQIDTLFRAGV